jgi:hemoglobin/transferrin/lactoferrin receptor protein
VDRSIDLGHGVVRVVEDNCDVSDFIRNLILLAGAACVLAAAADAEPAQPAGESELETVTVYARRVVPMSRVAASVTVIPRQSIERGLVSDVKELVRYEPGLSVRSDPFRFGLDTFAIRGVGGNRVAVEIDGIPAAGGFAIGSFSDSGRSFVDAAFLDRVEVLRGPASSLYGSDAIGGVVAMSTLTPRSLLGADGQRVLRTEAGASGVDDGWHAVAIGAMRFGAVEALLGYAHRAGSEADTAAAVVPNPRDYTSDSLLARLNIDGAPGGPLALTVEGGRLQQQTSVDAFLGLAGSRFANTTLLEGDDSVDRHRVSLGQRLPATAAFDSADWQIYAQGTDTRQDTLEERTAVPPRTPPVRIARGFRIEDRTFGAEFTAARDLPGDRVEQSLVYGFEFSRSRIEERRDGQQTNLVTGGTTTVILGESFPLRDFPVTDLTEAGVFVQDELRLGASGWTLIPALRADYYRLDPDPDRLYLEDNPSSAAVGLEDFALAPKLGVIRALGNGWTAFAQYARGFRAPPPEDVNIGLELPLFNVRAVPNPDLEPEKSDGYELGLRWESGGAHLAASAYYTDYRDFIESKVNLGPDPQTGVTLFQSQNIDEARIYGGELAASVRPGEWVPALEGVSARLSAAWARGEDRVRDEPLNSVDPASAVLSLGYEAPAGRWGGELVTTWVADKNAVDDSRVDLYRTDGYVTLDLLAYYDFGRGLSVNFGLFNLADAEYIEWSDVRGRVSGDPLIPYYTRPGRNLSMTVRLRL